MANQERGGRGLLGIIAPQQERTSVPVREKELAPPPTAEEVRAANAGEFAGATRTVERVGRNRLLKVALGGGAAVAGGAVAYETVPAVHRTVDSAFLDHIKGKTLSSEASTEVFDPTAVEGVIKPSMIERLSQKEIDRLDPFARIQDHNTILGIYPLDIGQSNNPNAELNFLRGNSGSGNEQDRINRAQEGFLNSFSADNVPKGTIVLAPVDGNLTVFTASGNRTPINDLDFNASALDFLVNGEEYRIIISGEINRGINNRGNVFRSLTNAPIVAANMSPSEQLKGKAQAIPVKKGSQIFQVTDNNIVFLSRLRGPMGLDRIDLSKGEEKIINGQKIIVVSSGYKPDNTNLEFFSTPDGKLTTPQK